jgi:DNA-binding winged helix-turn-helix (wHTH) protein
MPIYPLRRVFYPQNRPCTPTIVRTLYMQGYKVKEKTAIVPHCTPSFKTQWAPCIVLEQFQNQIESP